MTDRLLGIDGCAGGWVVAIGATAGRSITVEAHETLDAAIGRSPVGLIGIDIPMALPSMPPRQADAAARALLGPRRSSLFPTPPAALVDATSYAEANALSRALFGCGLSRQSWNLFPKICEARATVGAHPAGTIVEVHPECSFAVMTARVLPPKRTAEGRAARTVAVAAWCDEVDAILAALPTTGRARPRPDDVLDALAALWSVRRLAAGTALRLGDEGPHPSGMPTALIV